MPKYFQNKVAGYYLYYTKHCIIECMHAHASDKRLTESGSAKFFVKSDGSTVVQEKGVLTDIQINKIQKYIKKHYMEMYLMWSEDSEQGFYEG
jgi:hypothetical protein